MYIAHGVRMKVIICLLLLLNLASSTTANCSEYDIKNAFWKWSCQFIAESGHGKTYITATKLSEDLLNTWKKHANDSDVKQINYVKNYIAEHNLIIFILRIKPPRHSNGLDLRNIKDRCILYGINDTGDGSLLIKFTGNLNDLLVFNNVNPVYGALVFRDSEKDLGFNYLRILGDFKGWNHFKVNDAIPMNFTYQPDGVPRELRPSKGSVAGTEVLDAAKLAFSIVRLLALKR